MTWAPGPVVTRRRLGGELKRLRERCGLKLEDVARRLECSPSKISRLENGKGIPKFRDVRDMLDAYGVGEGESRDQLLEWARTGRSTNWWSRYADVLPPNVDTYIGLEWDALSLQCFEPLVVHGLLQTEEYARAVLSTVWASERTEAQIERMVEVRLLRGRALADEHGLSLHCVLDESILHRVVGFPAAMHRQLDHLLGLADLDNVELRVFPYSAGLLAANLGPFATMAFSSGMENGLVHIERPDGSVFMEGRDEVMRYQRLLDDIAGASLTAEHSVQKLKEARALHG